MFHVLSCRSVEIGVDLAFQVGLANGLVNTVDHEFWFMACVAQSLEFTFGTEVTEPVLCEFPVGLD